MIYRTGSRDKMAEYGFGNLDARITIRRVTEAQSVSGYPAQTWADAFTTFAKIMEFSSGDEKNDGSKLLANYGITAYVRHDSQTATISAKDRLKYNGQEYDIENIAEVFGRARFYQIRATLKK